MLPGPAQGWDSILGVTARARHQPGATSSSGCPFPSSRSCLVPALSQSPSPFHVMSSGVAQWMLEELTSHGSGPGQPERCAMTTFGGFLTDFGFSFYFLLKPESAVALAEGTGTFPDRVETFPAARPGLCHWEISPGLGSPSSREGAALLQPHCPCPDPPRSSPWRSPIDSLA